MTPDALRLDQALQRSPPLAQLRELLRDANARFAAIRPGLPEGMVDQVRPGPVDETGWSLLARNASVAAKLRQVQPHLEALLRDGGWTLVAIRIKVQVQAT